ncbi:MAG: branched-chain-amino-acid transaminase [Nitrospirota bacterium]
MIIYLNGELVERKDAVVSVFDHGFLYGDGIYETLRAYNGRVFMLDEHIERLFRSASLIKLHLPLSKEEISTAVYITLSANGLKDAYIRITVSRGMGEIGLDPDLCPIPTIVIIARELKGYPEELYEKGIKITIVNVMRNHRDALNPQIKSLNFLNNILAKIEAKDKGAYEGVMLNIDGHLTEGTITNIFFIKDRRLLTPSIDAGILDGITRGIVLKIAREKGMETVEGLFHPEDLYTADEVFITNSTIEILPAIVVDNRKIKDGFPGLITMCLLKIYREVVAESPL